MEKLQTRKIPLEDIISATDNFNEDNIIGRGGFGNVYKGKLSMSDGMRLTVAIKRLDTYFGQGNHEFLTEITMLSCYKHENLVSLVGYCDERGEKVLVCLYESKGSLDRYINDMNLNWIKRLQISIDVARGLNYLHYGVGKHHRILHRDIKSSNILFDKDWKAKVSDFGLSVIGPSNIEHTFVVVDPVGTRGYVDPAYFESDILTKESDTYSFGVVLFEILCGRLAYLSEFKDVRRYLGPLAKSHFEQNKLDEIINPDLRKQMQQQSLNTFSSIAYQCLNSTRSQRPTMVQVLGQLEEALRQQVIINIHNSSRSSINPKDAEAVYLKDNVSIHPAQSGNKGINGRLKLNKQGYSLFLTWIPYEGQSSNQLLSENKNLYTPLSDIQSIRHRITTIGWQFVIIFLSSGLIFPPLYFYSGGVLEFLDTISRFVFTSRSRDPNLLLVNKWEQDNTIHEWADYTV